MANGSGKSLGRAGGVVAFFAGLALAVTFVAAGFMACLAPPATSLMARMFVDDATSPFNRDQLVSVAEATRDYSFGSHDLGALYQTIYDVDRAYADSLTAQGATLPAGFPALVALSRSGDVAQLKASFAGASEMYAYSPDTISHLDDCYHLATRAKVVLAVVAVLALAGCIFVGVKGGKRRLGTLFMASGIALVVAFAALGVWAFVDFNALFTTFHSLFFKAGSWTFPYDSLLICALPTAFWIGMAVIWLVVSMLVSIIFVVIGVKVRK